MRVRLALLAGVVGLLGACEGDGAGPATTAAPAAGVTPTPSPESPFCAAFAAVVDRIENDPPGDVAGYVADAYRDLLPVAPAEIVPAIEALIVDLDGEAAPAASAPATAADSGVADDVAPTAIIVSPGEQLADYVDETCNRVGANPGPAATQPP